MSRKQAFKDIHTLGFNLRSVLLFTMLSVIIFGAFVFRIYVVASLDFWVLHHNFRTHTYWYDNFGDMPGVRDYALQMLAVDQAKLKNAKVASAICWLPFAIACFIALVPVIRRGYTWRDFLVIKYTFYASLFYLLRVLSYPT